MNSNIKIWHDFSSFTNVEIEIAYNPYPSESPEETNQQLFFTSSVCF